MSALDDARQQLWIGLAGNCSMELRRHLISTFETALREEIATAMEAQRDVLVSDPAWGAYDNAARVARGGGGGV